MNNREKLIWDFIIEKYPQSINVKWSYYSGFFDSKEGVKKFSDTSLIDWNKTKPLHSDSKSAFTDTFHDPEYIDVLCGRLVLTNGEVLEVGLTINSQELLNNVLDYMIEKSK